MTLLFPAHDEVKNTDVQSGVCSTDLFNLAYTDACVKSKAPLNLPQPEAVSQ